MVCISRLLGESADPLLSLAPKFVTASIAEGPASLTPMLVMLTDIMGAIITPCLLTVLGVRD